MERGNNLTRDNRGLKSSKEGKGFLEITKEWEQGAL